MENKKILNLLDNKPNQSTKFRTKNWVENAHGTYNTIFVKETITIAPVPPPGANPNNNDKEVIFKNCAPFTDCISKIKNTQINNAKYIDLIMPMNNLIEYSNNY